MVYIEPDGATMPLDGESDQCYDGNCGMNNDKIRNALEMARKFFNSSMDRPRERQIIEALAIFSIIDPDFVRQKCADNAVRYIDNLYSKGLTYDEDDFYEYIVSKESYK